MACTKGDKSGTGKENTTTTKRGKKAANSKNNKLLGNDNSSGSAGCKRSNVKNTPARNTRQKNQDTQSISSTSISSTQVHPDFDKVLDLNDTINPPELGFIYVVNKMKESYPEFVPYKNVLDFFMLLSTPMLVTSTTNASTTCPFTIMA